jgi:hypothetical protein
MMKMNKKKNMRCGSLCLWFVCSNSFAGPYAQRRGAALCVYALSVLTLLQDLALYEDERIGKSERMLATMDDSSISDPFVEFLKKRYDAGMVSLLPFLSFVLIDFE